MPLKTLSIVPNNKRMSHFTINGELLRKLRVMKGLKQESVAKALGISQPRYCEFEHRTHINGELLNRLLEAMDYTHEEVHTFKKIFFPC